MESVYNKYEPEIDLEVHIQLSTNMKAFKVKADPKVANQLIRKLLR